MMAQSLAPPTSLSVHRAFVVAFHADADLQAGRFIGRAEHIVSGRATSFQSQEMLLAFMAQVLFVAIDLQSQSVRAFFQCQCQRLSCCSMVFRV